ncbi:hypothetical protein GGR52DRAFT_486626 [Hypoxylon sp. FL1284]|nr:hypothetical protein GGR52DRAFT_486626 [Hypoxylon sp. FL1284]
MAKNHEIDYKGLGGAGDVSIRSDPCPRDYSQSSSSLSLSDNGHALYSHPIPTFADQTRSPAQCRPPANVENTVHTQPSPTPSTIQSTSPQSDEVFPLARFCREAQSHERLALGLPSTHAKHSPTVARPWVAPTNTDPGNSDSVGGASSLSLDSNPAASLTATKRSETSSTAELHELLDKIESPRWKDSVPLEEQVQYLLRATVLKRRVRSESHPRKSKPPKVRKRSHSHKSPQSQ